MASATEAGREAFVVVRTDGTVVLPLQVAEVLALDSQGAVVDSGGVIRLRWDGHAVRLEDAAAGIFVGGKRVETPCVLKPGEEVQLPRAKVVAGVTVPLRAGGRRALTHHEFRERLYEELARALRSGRRTCLVMVAARHGEGRRIVELALDRFRAGDLVASYAADEPEFLLPDTDEDHARVVVARLLEEAGVDGHVGVAVAPVHAETAERLIRSARRALADAMRDGEDFRVAEIPTGVVSEASDVDPEVHDASTVALASRVHAASDHQGPVLFTGEVSVGKSAYARMLHARSERRGRFVVRHGATFNVAGSLGDALGEAAGGTLFVEELTELELGAQEQLAHAQADFEKADVRLMASTERALGALVARSAFNEKLWLLLEGEVIDVPPLRHRPEDILPLAASFSKSLGGADLDFSAGAVARLRSYPWPGNVLELRNAIERAVRLASDGVVLAEHLPSEPMPMTSGEGRLREHVDSVERDAIIRALADTNHNQTHAAKRLGVSRRALIYKMEKYGLKRPPKSVRKG